MSANKRAAIAQLEQISPDYDRWPEVYRRLVDTYYQLLKEGDYSRTERSNPDAESEARYHLGMELYTKGNLRDAAAQLAEIPPKSKESDNARSSLAKIYVELGQQERGDRHWRQALEWWNKAMALSPSLEDTLRGRYREARVRAWLDDHGQELALIGILFTILAVCVGLWEVGALGPFPGSPTPTNTVTAPMTSLTSTATVTLTTTRTDTPTATRTRTPTPSHTATHSPSPTPSATPPTPPSTRTPTRRPTNTSTFTFTPTRISRPPTEPPPPPSPTPPTPPPTPTSTPPTPPTR